MVRWLLAKSARFSGPNYVRLPDPGLGWDRQPRQRPALPRQTHADRLDRQGDCAANDCRQPRQRRDYQSRRPDRSYPGDEVQTARRQNREAFPGRARQAEHPCEAGRGRLGAGKGPAIVTIGITGRRPKAWR
jgi:hypothetical protein